jgi:hypothetical protein
MTLLPPVLGGAPTQPLEVGRATRVVSPAQRSALTVRDGGCRFPGCDRPVAWCDAHHHAVHEGGWQLHGHPDGPLTAIPPHRRQPIAA